MSDLMMLLPGIRKERTLSILIREQLQFVLEDFGEKVFFADLNIRLGVLWVTVSAEPGLCSEVADAIRARIEGARVVCSYVEGPQPAQLPWMARVRRLLT